MRYTARKTTSNPPPGALIPLAAVQRLAGLSEAEALRHVREGHVRYQKIRGTLYVDSGDLERTAQAEGRDP